MQILTGPTPYLANPTEFDEVYTRGDQDNLKFYLREGLAENWATLNAKLNALPPHVRVGVRIIDYDHVPVDWPIIIVAGRNYPDFQSAKVRSDYREMLRNFKATVARVTWADIPFPYSGSNEPSITEANANALPGGKARYFADCKFIIDTYVAVFGRALCGNFIPDTWIATEMLPYQKAKGIRFFRQDSFMRFDWNNSGRLDGENRGTCYDARIAMLGGRDAFDRALFEQTGNGLDSEGKDQSYHTQAPIAQMFGNLDGEYYQLEGTDYFNMQLPGRRWVKATAKAKKHIDDWYAYVGTPSIPGPDPDPVPGDGGDGGDPDPVPVPYQFPVKVLGGEIVKAVFGGPYPDIVYDTADTVISIPIVNGERWNPRVTVASTTGSNVWTIEPAEPDGEDWSMSFHTKGRDSAVVTFEGYEPIPDPVPEPPDPVEPEFVTREEFVVMAQNLLDLIEALESGKADKVHGHEANVTLT